MADVKRYGDWTLYRRLWRQARPYRFGLLGLILLSLIGAPLALGLPLPVKIVVDHVLGSEPMPAMLAALIPEAWRDPGTLLAVCAVAVVVLAFLSQLHYLGMWLLQTWIGQKLAFEFRARIFDHIQRLSLGFHGTKGTADSVYRLQFDAPAIEQVAIDGAIPMVTAFVKVVVLLIAVAYIDWVLALIAIAGGPILFGLTELYRRRLRDRWAEVRERESAAMQVAQETLGAIRVVKAFGQEEREHGRYASRVYHGVDAAMSAVRAHGTFDLLVGITTGAMAAALLYIGARQVQEGAITLGELLLVMAYLSQLIGPLRELGTKTANLQKGLASAASVFEVLDEPAAIVEKLDAEPLDRAQGAFAFDDVTFAYVEGEPVLEHVTLDVRAGARVGVAGRTGSGKSTLLGLLPRFFDPTGGVVRLDGTDLRDLRLADLRRQFAIVLQESVLFSTTIGENIAYGRPDATQDEIEAAARAAAAHPFIAELPDGYDTEVGERGSTLSGGERQRIALARAFLCDAPVLLLDEPTSALDTGTETHVMDAVERLMAGRTTFIIAHRLSTLESCDLRLEIGDGRVEIRDDASSIDLGG